MKQIKKITFFLAVPVWTVSFIHFTWGLIFLFSVNNLHTTPTSKLIDLVGQTHAGVLYILASGFAVYGLLKPKPFWLDVMYSLPQQALMVSSFLTSIISIRLQQYPDGYPAPWDFILTDQLPSMAWMVIHAFVIIFLPSIRAEAARWIAE